MKIALAAIGFITNDIDYNSAKIKELVKEYSDKVDLIILGESFLQGFECLSWDYSKDIEIALEQDSDLMNEIRSLCREHHVGLSFGYIEKYKDKIYSSQLTLDKNGETLNNFRRVSTGWKKPAADFHYVEGDGFTRFEFLNKSISVALCGDLWYEENCTRMRALNADLVLWPVYTDFNFKKWNDQLKFEYAEQAEKCGKNVLYVNSYCLDASDLGLARGGAALFTNGEIKKESPSGEETVLLVEV